MGWSSELLPQGGMRGGMGSLPSAPWLLCFGGGSTDLEL